MWIMLNSNCDNCGIQMDWSFFAGSSHTSIDMAVSFYWDHSHSRDCTRSWRRHSFRSSIIIFKQEACNRGQVFIVVVKTRASIGNTVGLTVVCYQCPGIISRSGIWLEIIIITSCRYQCLDISCKGLFAGKVDYCQVSCDSLHNFVGKHYIVWQIACILILLQLPQELFYLLIHALTFFVNDLVVIVGFPWIAHYARIAQGFGRNCYGAKRSFQLLHH